MLNVGAGEITVILVVALLLLGPKRLPELARAIGKFMREFRRQTDEVRTTLESEFYKMDQDVMREPPKPQGPAPIPHGNDGHDEHGRLLPTISGPLDGGRRVADELGIKPPPAKIGSSDMPAPAAIAAPNPLTANAPPAEVPGTPAPYDLPQSAHAPMPAQPETLGASASHDAPVAATPAAPVKDGAQ